MATQFAGRNYTVTLSNLRDICVEFGKQPSHIKWLRTKKYIPEPRREAGENGRGSISLYPEGTDQLLRELLTLKKALGGWGFVEAYMAMIARLPGHFPLCLLPSRTLDWKSYQIDRALLDVLYASNMDDLKHLLFGAEFYEQVEPQSTLLACFPKVLKVASHMKKREVVFYLDYKGHDLYCVASDDENAVLMRSDGEIIRSYNGRDELPGPYYPPSGMEALPLEELERYLSWIDNRRKSPFKPMRLFGHRKREQFDPRCWHLLAPTPHGLEEHKRSPLERFDHMKIPSTAIPYLVEGLPGVVRADFLRGLTSDNDLKALQKEILPFLKASIRGADRDKAATALKGSAKGNDYFAVHRPEVLSQNDSYRYERTGDWLWASVLAEMDDWKSSKPLTSTDNLYRTKASPVLFNTDARTFILGRIRHLIGSEFEKHDEPSDVLRYRFDICKFCSRIFVKTNAPGEGQVLYCGDCYTRQFNGSESRRQSASRKRK